MHALYWGIWQFVLCVGEEWRGCSAFGPPATTLMLVCLTHLFIIFRRSEMVSVMPIDFLHTSSNSGGYGNELNECVSDISTIRGDSLLNLHSRYVWDSNLIDILWWDGDWIIEESKRNGSKSWKRRWMEESTTGKRREGEMIMVMNIRYSVVPYQWNGWIHWRLLTTLELVMSTVSSPYFFSFFLYDDYESDPSFIYESLFT